MPKKSYLTALLQGKCPRCREGDIFKYSVANASKFSIMNDHCPNCGVRLEPEPGFFQGAMYVGYGFTVAVIAVIGVFLSLTWNPSEWITIAIIIGVMVLLAPVNYRYSRIFYLYWFGGIRYKP